MKVIIDFDEVELKPLIEQHILEGYSVQTMIRQAVRLYNYLQPLEQAGIVTYSQQNFGKYNKIINIKEI